MALGCGYDFPKGESIGDIQVGAASAGYGSLHDIVSD